MHKVKSLLLGTVAGFAALGGAQAADMPAKARPVQYVKICSLYGDGFYYIPGTDTCLKLGGYLRVQAEYNMGNGGVAVGTNAIEDGQARFTRDATNDVNYRVRAETSWDVRQQTEYGPLRTYLRFGVENNTPGGTGGGSTPSPYWDRAFLQFAGFTVGRSRSFFDLFTYWGTYTYTNVRINGDTDITGQNLWAYTAELGNGFTATLSLEDPAVRKAFTFDATAAGFFGLNGAVVTDNAFTSNGANFGFRVPDIVANLRVDQAWGFAGVSVALHDASGAYYGTANNVGNGHPEDTYGWAIATGAKFNLPGGDIDRRQLRLRRGCHRLRGQRLCQFADVQFQHQRRGRMAFGRHLHQRHCRRTDAGVEHHRGLRARLELRDGERRGTAATPASTTTAPRPGSSIRPWRPDRSARGRSPGWSGISRLSPRLQAIAAIRTTASFRSARAPSGTRCRNWISAWT